MECKEKIHYSAFVHTHAYELYFCSASVGVLDQDGGHMRGHHSAFTDHILAFSNEKRVTCKQQTELHLVQKKREAREKEMRGHITESIFPQLSMLHKSRLTKSHRSLLRLNLYLF